MDAPEYIVIHDTDIKMAEHPDQLHIVDVSHKNRGYDESALGYHDCYHYFIGTTGKIVQTRPDSDRSMCTRNDDVNMKSLQIVLAGSFDTDLPDPRQVASLKLLTNRLQKKYGVDVRKIVGHQEASPTSCPGKHIMAIIQKERARLASALPPLTHVVP